MRVTPTSSCESSRGACPFSLCEASVSWSILRLTITRYTRFIGVLVFRFFARYKRETQQVDSNYSRDDKRRKTQ